MKFVCFRTSVGYDTKTHSRFRCAGYVFSFSKARNSMREAKWVLVCSSEILLFSIFNKDKMTKSIEIASLCDQYTLVSGFLSLPCIRTFILPSHVSKAPAAKNLKDRSCLALPALIILYICRLRNTSREEWPIRMIQMRMTINENGPKATAARMPDCLLGSQVSNLLSVSIVKEQGSRLD